MPLWQVDLYKQFKPDLPSFAVCCSPLVVGNRVTVSVGGKGRCGVALHADTGEVQWQALKEMKSYFSSGVSGGKLLFLVTNVVEPLPATAITYLEANTGKELWKKEKVGYFHAGLIRPGDDKLLVLNDSGVLTLLEIDPQGAKEVARAKVCGGTLVSPALADGQLYVRDDKEVICLQLTNRRPQRPGASGAAKWKIDIKGPLANRSSSPRMVRLSSVTSRRGHDFS
jgi:hypothetical protein